ncbi:hypothetical protein DRN62_01815 [Nanoarchaeota archaeon]|nr:MAG: hypothetical protein DRN62_01815 [Nanoarchaeota archaeon]
MLLKTMNKKGITPVVAIVLLLMMTVSSAAAAYYWMTTIQSDLQNKVAQNIQSTVGSAASLKIDAAECNGTSDNVKVYLRNPGDTDITDLKVYVYSASTGALINGADLTPSSLSGGATGSASATVSGIDPDTSYNIKVVGSPNVEATATAKCVS